MPQSTALSSKVNLQHAIIFRAWCSAKLVTPPPECGGPETLVLHRVALGFHSFWDWRVRVQGGGVRESEVKSLGGYGIEIEGIVGLGLGG